MRDACEARARTFDESVFLEKMQERLVALIERG
jgi:hypothetical protein